MTETLAHCYSSESILGENYSMNTNMTGFIWFSKIFASLWAKVASENWKGKRNLLMWGLLDILPCTRLGTYLTLAAAFKGQQVS